MARRTRLDMRREAEAAERLGDEAPAKKAKKKTATAKKTPVRRKTKKKVAAERMRMVWGVFDNGNQQVASFPYSDREDADKKVEELTAKGRGMYFVQPVKEPYYEEEADDASEV